MKGVTGPICCLLLLLFCCASSEKLGVQKRKKNLEQDATHALMKKLESLYKLSATDNSEIFNKEIESLKKQIDQLHQHGGENEEESLGHLIESEAANESAKKTIFGVDEDDSDNYDADFIGQSKRKIKGQAVADNEAQRAPDNLPAPQGRELSAASGQPQESARPQVTGSPGSQIEGGFVNTRTLENVEANGQRVADPQSRPAATQPEGQGANGPQQGERAPTERTAVTPSPSLTATPSDANDAKIKYLDKLYDEVLTTSDSTKGIHVPDYHSKYNTIRQKYEYSMNPVEYEIVKNLFNVGFKKEGDTSAAASLVDVFKKALADETFQAEFDNFVHGLYGFAKRHNYLSEARMKDADRYTNLLKNAISFMYTI
ncbi:merozoite surface protein 7 (MSP7) [Plasmodium vivax Mauritania I]|uniref:Merozoite surface protein 7 (MSP7) n=1 Tax=Plasmodium vivax Mauritania I TaxID=1035515 RepID=A0A0J9T8M9_PLAVI|nr:merozoite surface protein 7 (MSP7) [Plasmodium vivax Mauritania I]